jgi:hypothetical protein
MWIHPDEDAILTKTIVTVNYLIDDDVFRTVAKIGFNYLTHEAGGGFTLRPEFDAFRRFVRYGEGNRDDYVTMSTDPLLHEEKRWGIKQTRGHLLAAEWHPRKDCPTGSVKLFNDIHYHLRFATRMNCLWRQIRSGHHFDIADMSIDKMRAVWWRPA